jgi:hypothetical protein
MKYLTMIAALAMVMVTSPAWARSNDALVLRQNCAKLLTIYESQDKARLFAAQTTSLSDALHAGTCVGAVQEYLRTNANDCPFRYKPEEDWFEVARNIAENPPEGTLGQMLRKAHCGF